MDSHVGTPVSLNLKENLEGRIANLAMAPSYENTLIPLFEAIMNSIHSVQERFGEEWTKKGEISIAVERNDSEHPVSFRVEDNGTGLNKNNFDSFRTYDSRYKLKKGGKGVGRLTWLKVFESIGINSIYQDGDDFSQRKFDFVLDNDNAIQDYTDTPCELPVKQRTIVHLKQLKDGYRSRCPQRTETITHKIVAHFLPFLIGDVCPDIIVKDGSETFKLRSIIDQHTFNKESKELSVEECGTFTIQHLLLDKALIENEEHTVFLSAHGRVVVDHGINNQTGLDKAFEYQTSEDGNNVPVIYVGIQSGDFLDNNVTQERNNFDIEKKVFKSITKVAEEAAKVYLAEPIERVIELKAERIGEVVKRFPRYGYLAKDRKQLAKDLPLNRKSAEEIYKEMSVRDYRASNDLRKDMAKLVSKHEGDELEDAIKDKLANLMDQVGDQEKSALAEYIGKRKLVIDLLETRLGYEDKEKKRLHTEEAVHKVICPLRVNSGDIEFGQHNLWLIDDRLAYYDFWASDKRLKEYAEGSESKSRPDLILFQGSNLMHRKGTNQPIVIVEFKRPARGDYSDDENPLSQVFNYIRELADHKVTDNDGRLITEIDKETPFFCYIVCDITPRLLATMEDYSIDQKLPGGRGYFGYNKKRNAYVEILQYSQIVQDAKLRHEAFFDELGIN